jgi:hypothetical protein
MSRRNATFTPLKSPYATNNVDGAFDPELTLATRVVLVQHAYCLLRRALRTIPDEPIRKTIADQELPPRQ